MFFSGTDVHKLNLAAQNVCAQILLNDVQIAQECPLPH